MVSFIHTADWQLGAPNTLPACQFPLNSLVTTAKQRDISIIVCVGDIFHKPHPDQRTKDYLLQCLVENPEMLFIFMAGNHDYVNKTRDYSSLQYLSILTSSKKLDNVKVIGPGMYFLHKEAIFWALESWQDITSSEPPHKNGRPVVALWHGIVPGIDIRNLTLDKSKESADKLLKNGIHYAALGDIHKQWKINERCYYPGCLIQTSYVDELGALAVRLSKDDLVVDKVELDLPKKINFYVEFAAGDNSEQDIIDFVLSGTPKGNLVKLKFNLPVEVYASINKSYVKDRLQDHCLALEFDNDPTVTTRSRKNIDKVAQAKTIDQEIDAILATEDTDLNRDKLKRMVLEIINHTTVD